MKNNQSGISESEIAGYWEAKAKGISTQLDALASVMVTDDTHWAEYRDRVEKEHLFRLINCDRSMSILDLGCGIGRYSLEFARKGREVVAVDYSPSFIDYAKKAAENEGIENISYICQPVTEYSYLGNRYFDIIHLGGLLMYMDDESVGNLICQLRHRLKENGVLVQRDTTGIRKRIYGDMSNPYVCRTGKEYLDIFQHYGFKLSYSNYVMFPPLPAHLYNKLPVFLKNIGLAKAALKAGLSLLTMMNPFLLRQSWIIRLFIDPIRKITNRVNIYHLG